MRAVIWNAVSTKAQAKEEEGRESLPDQEAVARALCVSKGWEIIDVMTVPGHSRDYIDVYECAAAMRAAGIDALDRLIAHWKAKDFDVLVVRDGNRLARTQAMHASITEEVIAAGAIIYSMFDGMIDRRNFRMWISLNGYKAAAEIDEMKVKMEIGFEGRMKKGLPVNAHVVRSHIIERDPKTGKAARVVVNEALRREWDDLAELIISGEPWRVIEREMRARGHVSPLGVAYQHHHYYKLVHQPSFWGHVARYYQPALKGEWVFEPGPPLPEKVKIIYHSFPPVYTGETASLVKAELMRRMTIRGRAKPSRSRMFTSLLACSECMYSMSYASNKGSPSYRCLSRSMEMREITACSQRKQLGEKKAIVQVSERLQEMLDLGTPEALKAAPGQPVINYQMRLEGLIREIDSLSQTLRKLIVDKANADDDMRAIYDQEIVSRRDRQKALERELADIERRALLSSKDKIAQNLTYEHIKAIGIEKFWQQEHRVINQQLHALLAGDQFVVHEGKIRGLVKRVHRKRRF